MTVTNPLLHFSAGDFIPKMWLFAHILMVQMEKPNFPNFWLVKWISSSLTVSFHLHLRKMLFNATLCSLPFPPLLICQSFPRSFFPLTTSSSFSHFSFLTLQQSPAVSIAVLRFFCSFFVRCGQPVKVRNTRMKNERWNNDGTEVV